LVLAVILPLVLFGIGDEEAEEEPAPGSARSIDEVRGTYRGVGIGDSAAEVRRVFGPREDAGDGPFTPLGAGSFAEVGGAMFIASPGIPHTRGTRNSCAIGTCLSSCSTTASSH
jgi:hypothetical protein